MISRYTHNDLVWVDLESPTSEEVRALMEEFSLDPLVAEELLSPTLKPKVDYFSNYLYLILHFPAFKHTHAETAESQEVDFVIGKQFIITTRYDTIDPLHKFSKVFEVNSILDRSDIGEHAGFIFFYMVRKLYRAVEHELEYLSNRLKDVEHAIFEGKEKEMVVGLSHIGKELLGFKRTLHAHREVLSSFETVGTRFFGEGFTYHLKAIHGEYYRVYNEIEALFDTLMELRETNNSLLTTKQNEIMKTLTIMAFVTLPLSFLASIFSMNTTILPIVGHPFDFWIIIGIMVVVGIFLFSFFKLQRWL